jgi:protein disulfide-isomerase
MGAGNSHPSQSMKAILLTLMLLTIASAHAAPPPGWTDDYAKAVEKAKAEKKNVLLDFTGSDWCGYCMALDKEVFSTAHFKTWAKQNVVLVQVDFPHNKKLSAKVKAQNDELKAKYGSGGYPTILITDPDGKVITKKTGYKPGSGPKAYVEALGGTAAATGSATAR